MNARIKASLVPFLLLAAACSAELTDQGEGMDGNPANPTVGETEEALTRTTTDVGGTAGTTGSTATGLGGFGGIDFAGLTPRRTPRVMARSTSGSTMTLKLDRTVAADEIALSQMKVIVVRKSLGNVVRQNLATSASLSADKTAIQISLSEPVKAGEIYHPRGTWKPCSGSIFGSRCRIRPARFGEIVVRSTRSSPFENVNQNLGLSMSLVATTPTQPLTGLLATAQLAPAAAPPATAIFLDEAPLPAQGTFRVKSMTPSEFQTGVRRDVDRIIVNFEGGTIDCARTGRGKEAFHVYSSTDGRMEQSMYDAPANEGFRGRMRCEEDNNRIVFETPGYLLGEAWFKVALNAWSKEGNFMGDKILEFETQRPGLQMFATRVENQHGGDNTCDNDWFGANYCDVYVTTAVSTASQNETRRVPETGDFSGMPDFRVDPINGKRDLGYGIPIFARATSIDELVQVNLWAFDADSDSAWKGIFATAGRIAGAVGAGLLPIKPEAGAIAEGLAAGFAGLAEAIPSNEDDSMGRGTMNFTVSEQRWGTQASAPLYVDVSNNETNRGPVRVFLRTEEMPRSWQTIVIE